MQVFVTIQSFSTLAEIDIRTVVHINYLAAKSLNILAGFKY